MKIFFLSLSLALFTFSANADSLAKMPSCKKAAKLRPSERTECLTSYGYKFNWVRDEKTGFWGWQDNLTKAIWLQPKRLNLNHEEALDYCAEVGARLPSKEEFDNADWHQVYEAMPDFLERSFWSSTDFGKSGDRAVIYIANTSSGGAHYFYWKEEREDIFDGGDPKWSTGYLYARCVSGTN